jgi:hypothetical protein
MADSTGDNPGRISPLYILGFLVAAVMLPVLWLIGNFGTNTTSRSADIDAPRQAVISQLRAAPPRPVVATPASVPVRTATPVTR